MLADSSQVIGEIARTLDALTLEMESRPFSSLSAADQKNYRTAIYLQRVLRTQVVGHNKPERVASCI